MTNTWMLIASIIIGNEQPHVVKQEYVQKRYCIQAAENAWRAFYAFNLTNARQETVCVNGHNYYDVVIVKCDKLGVCTK